jgi:hypothetical protein
MSTAQVLPGLSLRMPIYDTGGSFISDVDPDTLNPDTNPGFFLKRFGNKKKILIKKSTITVKDFQALGERTLQPFT